MPRRFLARHQQGLPWLQPRGREAQARQSRGRRPLGRQTSRVPPSIAATCAVPISSGADLTDANLNKTELLQANFSRAKMKGAMLFEAEAGRADFTPRRSHRGHDGQHPASPAASSTAPISRGVDLSSGCSTRQTFVNATLNDANFFQGGCCAVTCAAWVGEMWSSRKPICATPISPARSCGNRSSFSPISAGARLSSADLSQSVLRSANLGNTKLDGHQVHRRDDAG